MLGTGECLQTERKEVTDKQVEARGENRARDGVRSSDGGINWKLVRQEASNTSSLYAFLL